MKEKDHDQFGPHGGDQRQRSRVKPRLDIPGVLLVSAARKPQVDGVLQLCVAAGVALLAAFAFWQTRAPSPLLPPRIVLDRNRGGAYASMLIAASGMFGIFLFLTYYLQQTLGYSPLVTGFAVLPMSVGLIVMANLSAPTLSAAARQEPERAVQFYATDDPGAGDLVADLIRTGGYEPVRVGGLDQSIRIEMFGDLHEYGALGRTVTESEALAAV